MISAIPKLKTATVSVAVFCYILGMEAESNREGSWSLYESLFLVLLNERNKIKILLRSKYICVIISVSSQLRGFFYEALFRLSADSA